MHSDIFDYIKDDLYLGQVFAISSDQTDEFIDTVVDMGYRAMCVKSKEGVRWFEVVGRIGEGHSG